MTELISEVVVAEVEGGEEQTLRCCGVSSTQFEGGARRDGGSSDGAGAFDRGNAFDGGGAFGGDIDDDRGFGFLPSAPRSYTKIQLQET
jgi:hypothetical protein